jgi:micrococcal nuclease
MEVFFEGNGHIVRLIDIDCPEKKQAFGKAAKKFTSDFCFNKIVKVESMGKKDRYGRILATVYLNGKSLNEALLKAGLAWHFKKYSTNSEYAELENQARKEEVGLWADENPVAPWEFRKK